MGLNVCDRTSKMVGHKSTYLIKRCGGGFGNPNREAEFWDCIALLRGINVYNDFVKAISPAMESSETEDHLLNAFLNLFPPFRVRN